MIDPCGGRRFRHGRISRGRYQLLSTRYRRVRQQLKRERKRTRRVRREALELNRALIQLEEIADAVGGECVNGRAGVVCECCFATIKPNTHGGLPHEKCKGCLRRLCSNCCFASEKAPLWYCCTCIVEKKLLPIWRPTTERRPDRVLSVCFLPGCRVLEPACCWDCLTAHESRCPSWQPDEVIIATTSAPKPSLQHPAMSNHLVFKADQASRLQWRLKRTQS